MGYHATVQAALYALLEAALPNDTPVINGLAADDIKAERYASCVVVVRESIEFEPVLEINPTEGAGTQVEEWSWALFVKGGGGKARGSGRAAEVDFTLETIRDALNAQRLTTECGPLSLEAEEYLEPVGTGVLYAQRWRHSRIAE